MSNSYGEKYTTVSAFIFIVLSIWWMLIQAGGLNNDLHREIFSATYGLMALWGGLFGLYVSKKWGGIKSTLGKAVLLLSIGLLLQEFGQLAYSYYYYLIEAEVPYPSLGDVGYFSSIFFYIAGAWYVSSVVGIKFGLTTLTNKLLGVVLPVFSILVSYNFFVKGLDTMGVPLIETLLNVGYPVGQSIYVAIALLGYMLSRKLLGGAMKAPLSLLLLSLMLQYCSDFVFLYQTAHETWQIAGINEYMYLVSYFIMTISMVSLFKLTNLHLIPNAKKQNG